MEQIKILKASLSEYNNELKDFYAHKGLPWTEDIGNRIDGKYADYSIDYFLVYILDNKIVSGVWYCLKKYFAEIAMLGHVYTKPEYRNRGYSKILMQETIKSFKDNNVKVMYLQVENPIAQHIYEKFGFKKVCEAQTYTGENKVIMRYLDRNNNDFEKNYFKSSKEIIINKINIGDFPGFEALYTSEHPWRIRSYSEKVFSRSGFEKEFLLLIEKNKKNENRVYTFFNSEKHLIAVAIFYDINKDKIIDFFIHPNYLEIIKEQLQELITDETNDTIFTYIGACDLDKISFVEELGFKRGKILKDNIVLNNEKIDVYEYYKEVIPKGLS